MAQLEGRDVRAADYLVVCVHVATHAVGSWVLDLEWGTMSALFVLMGRGEGEGDEEESLLLFLRSFPVGHRSLRSSAGADLALPAFCGI
jgi:hypothetical protein